MPNIMETVTQQCSVICENTHEVISPDELTGKLTASLKKKKPLKVKVGFDPTACDIHLGHTVLLRKLRQVQDLGHTVYLVIGDFTARIGDPSGRMSLRPVLSPKEILKNAKTYTDQAFKILDKRRTEIVFNNSWFKSMKASAFVDLLSHYTIARILERDDFSKRLKDNKPLSLGELVYPIIQGYDSVKIEADIEFGGTDQKFNLIVGRHLQESFAQSPQVVITMPLLVGLDGTNKMSKSLGNYVGITENAKSMFGKVMSISDELMWEYAKLLTTLDIEQLKRLHPKEAKLILAQEIVSQYHSKAIAQKERIEFERIFSKKELPKDMPVYTARQKEIDVSEVLIRTGLVASKNEARRLIKQKGICVDDSVLDSVTLTLVSESTILRVGKRRFLKIVYQGK